MKKLFIIPFIFLFGLTFGCDSDLPTTSDNLETITETEDLIAEKRGFGASATTSPVYTFANMEEVGASNLVRSSDQLGVKIHTTGLIHHQAITLWWVIFNNPEECSEGACGEPDLFNPAVEPSCIYADGDIVGGNGHSRFHDRLKVGDRRDSCIDFFVDADPELEGEDYGLLNPEGAEVHFVIRSHGPLIPGMVPEMRSTFAGGCEYNLDPGVTPENPGECSDLQFAIHFPEAN